MPVHCRTAYIADRHLTFRPHTANARRKTLIQLLSQWTLNLCRPKSQDKKPNVSHLNLDLIIFARQYGSMKQAGLWFAERSAMGFYWEYSFSQTHKGSDNSWNVSKLFIHALLFTHCRNHFSLTRTSCLFSCNVFPISYPPCHGQSAQFSISSLLCALDWALSLCAPLLYI